MISLVIRDVVSINQSALHINSTCDDALLLKQAYAQFYIWGGKVSKLPKGINMNKSNILLGDMLLFSRKSFLNH